VGKIRTLPHSNHIFGYKTTQTKNHMKTTQPNFETVKQLFYHFAINSKKPDICILLETVTTGKLKSHYKRRQEFNKELNS
jgi:hypothetical protein